MNARVNVANNYFTKKPKVGGHVVNFSRFKTGCPELSIKLDEFTKDVNNGFGLYKESVLKKFISGYKEIDNFSEQFIKLFEYNQSSTNPTANTLEKFIINYGITIGTKKYNEKPKFKSGEDNPGFQHGGKLSPWSEKSVYHTPEVIIASKNKIIETKKDPSKRSNTTKEFWQNKGYSESEAILKVKERQRTFSLKKCIEKYGVIDGQKIFENRQKIWQETLNNKTDEEINRMNQLKGSGSGAGFVQQRIKNLPGFANKICTLYYLRFFNHEIEFWKIGVTSQAIHTRFDNIKRSKLKYEIIYEAISSYQKCFQQEQHILKKYKANRVKIDYNNFSTYEAFSQDVTSVFDMVF